MKTKISIAKSELEDKKRYDLFLRAVQMGLRDVGIEDISFSKIVHKDGRLIFDVERK
jgi:hypothetical protein